MSHKIKVPVRNNFFVLKTDLLFSLETVRQELFARVISNSINTNRLPQNVPI